MDSLDYSYNYLSSGTLAGKLSNNRLRRVRDFMSNAAAYDESDPTTGVSDLEDQTNADNYTYDAIGNLKSDAKENISLINWNVYGKITDINFGFVANKNKTIYYLYDAAGNRIGKQVEKYGATSEATTSSTYTWYVRDASGNVMATYNSSAAGSAFPSTLSLGERHLYGSSRLGILAQTADSKTLPYTAIGTVYGSNFIRGNKFFELGNHLGNVLVTISDKKIGVDDGTYDAITGVKSNSTPDNKIDYYTADVVTANDYYPFGMGMPGRNYNAGSGYRYGFNGKENDDEVKGEGNQQDYGLRIYDTRIGKFLSVDPLYRSFPWNSAYAFAENDVIRNIDLDGGEKKDVTTRVWHESGGNLVSNTIPVDGHNSYNLGDGTLVTTIIEYNEEEQALYGIKEYRVTSYILAPVKERRRIDKLGDFFSGKTTVGKNEFGFVLTGNSNGTRFDMGSDGVQFKESLDIGTMLSAIAAFRDAGGEAQSLTDFMRSERFKKVYDLIDNSLKLSDKLVEARDAKGQLKDIIQGNTTPDPNVTYCEACQGRYVKDPKNGMPTFDKSEHTQGDTTKDHITKPDRKTVQ